MNTLAYTGVLILGFVTLVWVISLIKRDAGIMDIFWGLGFLVVAIFQYLTGGMHTPLRLLVLLLVLVWGLRLALHIGIRNAGKPEDARYRKWREENGKAWWWRSYFKVFLLQGTVMWVVALPLYAVFEGGIHSGLEFFPWIGAGLFTVGFFFEAVADWQLMQFKKNSSNKGKVLDKGLWATSRHPNYFGEALIWWGFGLIGLSTGAWWALISPLIMNFLLVRVSGVKMLDALLEKTNPEYSRYMNETPSFLPMGRKKA